MVKPIMIKVSKSFREYYSTKYHKNVIINIPLPGDSIISYQLIIDSKNRCLENATGHTRYDKSL